MSEINKAGAQMLLSAAHDIKTPINAIIGYTQLAQKDINDEEKVKDYLEKINLSGQMLLELVNNVLSSAESESAVLKEKECSMNGIVHTVLSMFEIPALNKGLDLSVFACHIHDNVIADELMFKEILLNLVSNACKYTPAGGNVSVNVKELPCNDKMGLYVIEVSDTGIGMSEEFIPHIFDEFSREDSVKDTEIEGHGYGMSIVKKYVQLMNGSIEVESKPGQGTTFAVKVPLKIAEANEEKAPVSNERELFKGKRVLLAEDDEQNGEIAIELLTDAGLEVEHASDGQLLVQLIKAQDAAYYDLVITDIQMPELTGYQAAEEIRNMADTAKAGIPIIAMTANAFEEDRLKALDAGMNGLIAKPIDVKKLESLLASLW